MRESLFAILGPLHGLRFLDLFAGSGIMGLEAVSRGASAATCVEKDRRKRATIEENLQMAEGRVALVMVPAERFVDRCREPFDIVYLDPPFDYRYKTDLLTRIPKRPVVAPAGQLLIHYPAKEDLPDSVGDLRVRDERRYGGSAVRFYARD
jgi:16S rRNA (guanine(966)-N(2))-methyltransferase RsmD